MLLTQPISVIIPLYNKEDYIRRTVDSVLQQTHKNFELLIVDDGSTDDSLAQLASLRDSRIRVIRQDNAGEGAARNTGLAEATHDWVAFLDADDSWQPGFLGCVTEMITMQPELELCATGYQIRSPDGAELVGDSAAREYKIEHNYFSLSFENKLPFCASSVAINAEALRACGGFAENEPLGADQDLWCRLLTDRAFALHRYPHATYHQDASGRECNTTIPRGELPFSARLQARLDEGSVPQWRRQDAKRYIAAHLLHAATLNLRCGDLATASLLLDDPRTRALPIKRAIKRTWLMVYRTFFLKPLSNLRSIDDEKVNSATNTQHASLHRQRQC